MPQLRRRLALRLRRGLSQPPRQAHRGRRRAPRASTDSAPNAPKGAGGSNPSRPGSCSLARTAQSFASTLQYGLKRVAAEVAVPAFRPGPGPLHATLVIAGHPQTMAPATCNDIMSKSSLWLSALLNCCLPLRSTISTPRWASPLSRKLASCLHRGSADVASMPLNGFGKQINM